MYHMSADFWVTCRPEVFYKNSNVMKIIIFLQWLAMDKRKWTETLPINRP